MSITNLGPQYVASEEMLELFLEASPAKTKPHYAILVSQFNNVYLQNIEEASKSRYDFMHPQTRIVETRVEQTDTQ